MQGEKPAPVRWLGREDAKVTDKPYDIRPGDLVVIPAALAGWEILGHKLENSSIISGFTHEDDSTASSSVPGPVLLSKHLEGVRSYASRFGGYLPAQIAEDIQLAALCHDLGKSDPRFQALLHGDNPWIKDPCLPNPPL